MNVNEIGKDDSSLSSFSLKFKCMMMGSIFPMCCAGVSTDLNINLLRRHVKLTTYFAFIRLLSSPNSLHKVCACLFAREYHASAYSFRREHCVMETPHVERPKSGGGGVVDEFRQKLNPIKINRHFFQRCAHTRLAFATYCHVLPR